MKRLIPALVLLTALHFAPVIHGEDARPSPGQQVAQEFVSGKSDGTKSVIHYWLYLPKAATPGTTEKFPLVLFLHGSGERGTQLENVTKHGPPGMIGKNADLDRCIIVSPQCPEKQSWNAPLLKELCDDVAKKQPVDVQRLYVTGLSMGGFGSWELLASYPGHWAAAVPICGGGKPGSAEKFKHVPIWVFHGAKDTAVPVAASEKMIAALEAAGGKPKFTVYPEEGHASWVPAYKDPELWKWLLAQKRPAAK